MAWVLSQNRCKFREDSTAQRVSTMDLSPQAKVQGFQSFKVSEFQEVTYEKIFEKSLKKITHLD